jgi:hypothetical protein
MSEDGKGIVMRKEDLREATKRAGESQAQDPSVAGEEAQPETHGHGGSGLQHRAGCAQGARRGGGIPRESGRG